MFSMRSMINLKSQTSCKPRAIELALIAEAQPMFIMRSMINLKPQTYSTYSTFTASPLRISAKACGLMVTGPFINSGML